ncbi:MAG: hypothetical protein PF961_08860 [Planctomycetota bacterium]|nr:hypothetical protein [Planctomycetota bacterium]
MRDRILALNSAWCHAMRDRQLPARYGSGLDGGLLCPACSRIHGRSADAAYPFLRMASDTGDASWIDAATAVVEWSECLSCPDGAWVNDQWNLWKGTTVFTVTALAEALRHYRHLLSDSVASQWRERIRQACSWLMSGIRVGVSNINYPLTCPAALQAASMVCNEPRFAAHAAELMEQAATFIDDQGLVVGEGRPLYETTKRGCRPVDVGYNFEESIPGMLHYAELAGNHQIADVARRAARAHLALMLPDGGLDNSFGTRNYKWTWWGSRTADGALPALLALGATEGIFATAAERQLGLLERCTHQGLLHGGVHHHASGERPCLHHSFCHAKAFTAALDQDLWPEPDAAPLPMEQGDQHLHLHAPDTHLISRGPWRATVTGNDVVYNGCGDGHASGGALSLLYHREHGPVLCASMATFRLIEGHNMQRDRHDEDRCLTPRLCANAHPQFRSDLDRHAQIAVAHGPETTEVRVTGHLVNASGEHPPGGPQPFAWHIALGAAVSITATCSDATLHCPIITAPNARVEEAGPQQLAVNGVTVQCSVPIDGGQERCFNQVPGFAATPVSMPCADSVSLNIRG